MRKQILTAIIALLTSVVAQAQVAVTEFTVTRSGDVAEVVFTARADGKAVKSNYKITLTPVIANEGNAEKLTPIIIQGNRRRTMDARNRVEPTAGAFVIRNGQSVSYRSKVPYADWMRGADIRFEMQRDGCCSEQTLAPYLIAQNITVQGADDSDPNLLNVCVGGMVLILERNAPLPEKNYVMEPASAIHTKMEELTLDFRAGSSRLDPNICNNHKTLDELIATLRSSKDTLSSKIDITGYASPEGVANANYALAQNRALAVRNYILDNVPSLRPGNFNLVNGGENWEGLRKLVEESAMPGRWQVIDIIDNTLPRIDYVRNTSRKKDLMNLNGGQTWNYMLETFFPQLRNAASVVIYKAVEAGVTETFPASNVETINRAIGLIGERKASEALVLLYEVLGDPRAWNPMGVCYVLLENTEKAKEYLQKAADAGYIEAKMNMNQLK